MRPVRGSTPEWRSQAGPEQRYLRVHHLYRAVAVAVAVVVVVQSDGQDGRAKEETTVRCAKAPERRGRGGDEKKQRLDPPDAEEDEQRGHEDQRGVHDQVGEEIEDT